MGANNKFYKRHTKEYGSKERKRLDYRTSIAMDKEGIQQLRDFYRGPVTGTYTDMFGIDWDLYDKTKIFFIQNIGSKRQEILDFLKENYSEQVFVLVEESIFRWVEVIVFDEQTLDKLRVDMKEKFDCTLGVDW